jgi:UDP-N-acetylmuramyl tripeptide synthase
MHYLRQLILLFVSYLAKILYTSSRIAKIGSGTSLPGWFVERFCPWVLQELDNSFEQVIFITGTNGKTTTRAALVHIFENAHTPVCTNRGGANILRGISTTLLLNLDMFGRAKSKIAILEVEEATLPKLTTYIKPDILILTNVFRDQLDVYGEVDKTLSYFKEALQNSSPKVLVNADDSKLLSCLSEYTGEIHGFTLDLAQDQKPNFESTQTTTLKFHKLSIARNIHIQDNRIDFEIETDNQIFPLATSLPGTYNIYNLLPAFIIGYERFQNQAATFIQDFHPVFGRGEEIVLGKNTLTLMLVKNPAGFDQVLQYLSARFSQEPVHMVFLINDKIADGKDVSWLWDIHLEEFLKHQTPASLHTGGSRGLDFLLRLQYAGQQVSLENHTSSIQDLAHKLETISGKTIVLATYTALMEFRKALESKTNLKPIDEQGN